MNKSKSASKCIEDNDMECAVYRWENTTKRYKDYWFETIKTIYNQCKEWAKVYVIDLIEKVVNEIVTPIKRKVFNEEKPSWCYWIRILDYGKLIYNKIGTTQENDPYTRLNAIIKKGWSNVSADRLTYEVKRIYNLGSMPPEGLESEFRAKLIKKYKGKNYIKNDRFEITNEKDEPTFEEMDNWALEYGATILV